VARGHSLDILRPCYVFSVQGSFHVPPGIRVERQTPNDLPLRKAHDTQNMSKKMRAKLLFVRVRLHERSSNCSNFHTSCALCIANPKPLYRPDATFVCHSIVGVGGRPMRKQKLKEAKRRIARGVLFLCVMHKAGQLEVCVAKTFKTLYFANIKEYPACAFSKTYRKMMLFVRRGGANYCCGGIENIELDNLCPQHPLILLVCSISRQSVHLPMLQRRPSQAFCERFQTSCSFERKG